MANILLVDPDEVAQRAMKGIIARGPHRLAAVGSATEARDFIFRNVLVDLVFVELDLDGGESGLSLLQDLRRDCFLHALPVTVYTSAGSRDTVRQALSIGVQNFLIKPYVDTAIFAELAKAATHCWRDGLFVPEPVLCARLGLAPGDARAQREAFLQSLEKEASMLRDLVRWEAKGGVQGRLEQLAEDGTAVGATALVTFFEHLHGLAEEGKWGELTTGIARLEHARRLVHLREGTEPVPEDFATDQEKRAVELRRERETWARAVAENNLPVLGQPQLLRELEDLPGCPVVDSVGAAFQMAANGHPSSLSPLMDQAERDPGLSAQLLIVTNKMRRHDEMTDPVDSARLCVGLLGESRLSSLARGLVLADTTALDGAGFSWSQFWMFQVGVARLARDTCTYLELESLEIRAYTAGLLHDLGKLLLLHLHPCALLSVLDYARQHQLLLPEAERRLFDWTTREMAVHFAEKRGLPGTYCQVIRHLDTPAEAGAEAELTAIVSLARDLCAHNHVGSNGEVVHRQAQPLDQTPQWEVLRSRIFPSFNLRKFELQVHNQCREMKREFSGRSLAACV